VGGVSVHQTHARATGDCGIDPERSVGGRHRVALGERDRPRKGQSGDRTAGRGKSRRVVGWEQGRWKSGRSNENKARGCT